MRVHEDKSHPYFQRTKAYNQWVADLLYKVELHGLNTLPPFIDSPPNNEALIESIYPADDRCLLATTNLVVWDLNDEVYKRFPGVEVAYRSHDTQELDDITGGWEESVENMWNVNLPSIQPAILKLKICMPVICTRTLMAHAGPCNGSRGILTGLQKHVVEIMLLGGQWHGKLRYIPRIPIKTNPTELHYTLIRKQFPLRPCFAMTINKSQGQSFVHVGVD
ncbi:putative atp-dependent dna helicase pif1 [Golovinomyces cichoracearum]|uniref:Putative atp-dependent dna helicase pif1 n=1 Tax=Golovinomyces cichoracearum TaxID=62708 RepID=A0A420HCR9_9PEZI|nr:putative atp-dependent dna helicase pif1 [Golovinomyces cichoracearum]